ncbi:hypothetical protein FIBSPDRAFT_1056154 [Athelia psychrophila]|uniref:Uncharacterized protein n=1 Tax=Athelia psychrophila TaxID=1759441 RepID=A0A167SL84_9AGAM|nr:hypothetical protein FIBSPDRAFT_1056154 [Fibularhizoctonia sp. CBS 109695]
MTPRKSNLSTVHTPDSPQASSSPRPRFFTSHAHAQTPHHPGPAGSPTSTLSGSGDVPVFTPMLSMSSTTALSATHTPSARRVTVRADPGLVSCFDSADKELYALWAPLS